MPGKGMFLFPPDVTPGLMPSWGLWGNPFLKPGMGFFPDMGIGDGKGTLPPGMGLMPPEHDPIMPEPPHDPVKPAPVLTPAVTATTVHPGLNGTAVPEAACQALPPGCT